MKKFSTKIIAALLSFVFMFTGVFAIAVNAEDSNSYYSSFYSSYSHPLEIHNTNTHTRCIFFENVDTETTYVSTPNTENGVEAIRVLNDYSSFTIAELNLNGDLNFPNATRLSTATAKYNCHSYAWYSRNVNSNDIWIDDPSLYYEDGSYYEVSTPEVGDIICYFSDMGTSDTSDDSNLHSGVVTEVLEGVSNGICGTADLVTVTSKWGPSGLYSHNGLYCPYTSSAYDDKAEYVKYFRHVHKYTYSFMNGQDHLRQCGLCNDLQCLPHDYELEEISNSQHRSTCTNCGFEKNEAHCEYNCTSKNNSHHYVYCECGFLIRLESHVFSQIGIRKVCRGCGYTCDLDETIPVIKDKVDDSENQ